MIATLELEENEHNFYVQMCANTSDDFNKCRIVSRSWNYDVTPDLHLDDDIEMGDRTFEDVRFDISIGRI
jgi:hypothetical protein